LFLQEQIKDIIMCSQCQWGRDLLSSRLIQGMKCTHQSLDPGVLCRIAQISLSR